MVDRGREDHRSTWAGKAREAQEGKGWTTVAELQMVKKIKNKKNSVELDAVPGDLKVQSQWVGRARS